MCDIKTAQKTGGTSLESTLDILKAAAAESEEESDVILTIPCFYTF